MSLVHVPFHGDELLATQDEAGDVWVSVRRVCEALGIDYSGQRTKLNAKAWARVEFISTPSAGGSQETFCVHLWSLPMWLANIDEGRVAAHVRPKLERYQLEAADALADHFLRSQREADHEAFIARLIVMDPIKRDQLFPTNVWRAVEALYREDAETAIRPSAAFKGYVGNIYLRFFGEKAKSAIRRLNPDPEHVRDYSYLSEVAFGELKQHQWHKVEAFALSAFRRFGRSRRARDEFWADLNHLTGYKPLPGEPNPADPRQLLLFGRVESNDGEAA